MKYLHDGQDYVAWLAGSGHAHAGVAIQAKMNVQHAGHLHFRAARGQVKAYGESITLRMQSQKFEFPEENWALLLGGKKGDLFISSNKAILEKLCGPRDKVEPAEWIHLQGSGIDADVSYPAFPGMENPPREYLVNMS